MFLGRDQELNILRREYGRDRPSLIVVYGRRRVGKSTLLLESLKGRELVYYQASRLAGADSRAFFKRALQAVLGNDPLLADLADWGGILAYLQRAAIERPGLTVVIDEFPYLCEAEPSLPSVLQAAWDRVRADGTRLKLVLCGSSIAFMESLLAERNPLHGRHTVNLDVAPLSYREAAGRFGRWSSQDRLSSFGIFGGMPYYLSLCEPDRSLRENIEDVILDRGAPLHDEPTQLLHAELTAVGRYASILHAIADGNTEWGDIVGRVPDMRNGAQIGPYLERLTGLRLVEVVRSLDADERARNRRYVLQDPFLTFWYRFVLPNRSALEAGHVSRVYEGLIEPHLDDHMGGVFERICRDFVRYYGQEAFPAPGRVVGPIWSGEYDIDVAATLLDGSVLFGECKWWKDPVGANVLARLERTAAQTTFERGNPSRILAVFARSGFTPELRARAAVEPRLKLIAPPDLLGAAD